MLPEFTDVFSEYDTAGIEAGTGPFLSGAAPGKGEASNGGTLATGFCKLGATGGELDIGLTDSSTTGAVTAGTGAGAGILGFEENRLAHDLPGAGCGWGCITGGGGSVRLRGVGGGGKSEAVGAGGGG